MRGSRTLALPFVFRAAFPVRSGTTALTIEREVQEGYRPSCKLKQEPAVMIPVTRRIVLEDEEIEESFIRASGPGGQNVNKVSTAVQIRFDARRSPGLPDDVFERLVRIAGKRMTRDGVIIITAQRYRSQERNREDAIARLVEMIQEAAVRPAVRRETRPTYGSKQRRLAAKAKKSQVKSLRQSKPGLD